MSTRPHRRPRRNLLLALCALLALLVTILSVGNLTTVNAQAGEPTAIIDAVLKDLSQKLGKSLTRNNVDNWTWEETIFPDASLGCPQPGQTYAQGNTRGYKITITVSGTVYDYRALSDGSKIFMCTPSGGAPAVAATPTQEVIPPTVGPATGGQPVTFQKALTYVGANGNVMITAPGQGAGVPITNDASIQLLQTGPFFQEMRHYDSFRWSPDGTKLLFREDSTQSLYLAISGQAPIQIARGLSYFYPGTWSPDGTEIAYAVSTGQQQGDGEVQQIQAVLVTATGVGQPRVAGSFVEQVGCGGATSDVAEIIYRGETTGDGNSMTLEWVAQGFVYSPSCSGLGLALVDPNGRVLWTVADAARVAISPDRTRAVAIRQPRQQPSLITIDLSNGNVTPLQSEPNPDQVAWSADGSTIVYSTVTPADTIQGNPQSSTGQQLFGNIWPVTAYNFTVALWRMPSSGGQSTQMFQQPGRGIGVIASAPDNSGVAFSFVPSLVAMIQQINNGASADQVLSLQPRPHLLYVNWTGAAIQLNSFDGGRPAFSTGMFTAIPASLPATAGGQAGAPSPNPNIAPPNLVVGGQAVVSTTRGDTLNLRQSPSRSAPVLRILKPGTVVKILAGPQSNEGFRWWQVQATDDNSVGWVVDQVIDQDGATNTLTPQ